MAAPVWVTPPGDLGTIVENEFYQIQLNATNASYYKHLSGILPRGIQITPYGSCEGYPKNLDFIQGVPTEVGTDTTNRFVVRAVSADGSVADRVFELTVTGEDEPEIETLPPAFLGSYFDGDLVNETLTARDDDPGDTITWRVISGALPTGVTLSTAGLLYGYIDPVPTNTGTPGFDVNAFDIGSFDFRTLGENKTYEFTVEASDGKAVSTKTYTMFVAARSSLTADTTEYTADIYAPTADSTSILSMITADSTSLHTPAMLTASADIGIVKHDNFFAYQFVGKDFDGDPISFEITTGAGLGYDGAGYDAEDFDRGTFSLPPGLTLDETSGWLSGYIPQQAATTIDYQFAVRVKKTNNSDYASDWVYFTMTIEGDIDSTLTWPAADLGILKTGEVSQLDVIATIASGRSVSYEFKTGYENKLPQGLRLDDRGFIVGRVSFETFMLDTGLTTFDVNDLRFDETTWDREYTFTVRAFSPDGVIDTYKTFTITLQPSSLKPYESLYARALPSQTQRDIYESLIQNVDDIDPNDVYRPTDFHFGIQNDIRFLVAAGLNPSTESEYVSATAKNHWNNTLRFGDLATARALNDDGTVKYEVVYVKLTDKGIGVNPTTGVAAPASQSIELTLQQGWENPLSVDASWPKVSSSLVTVDSVNDRFAYPNAIENMRTRMKDYIGNVILERYVLPEWMQDKQEDGKVIGWTLAAPIVYCKPGTAKRIKFLLEQRFTTIDLKKITFEVDRYILDNNLSKWFDKTTGKYTVTQETTFDVDLAASSPGIDNPTTFDGNGTRFFASVDVYAQQDEGDKYIKFPRRNVFR